MTVIERKMLIKVDGNVNNNKFYELILDSNGSYVTRWGRVGTTGRTKILNDGRSGYLRTLRNKLDRGYREVPILNSPDDSSPIQQNQAEVSKAARASLLSPDLRGNPELEKLIDRLVAVNRHEIIKISGGMITIDDSGVVKTALGVVSPTAIRQARQILDRIAAQYRSRGTYRISDLEEYLALVPQKITSKRGWKNFFPDGDAVDQQYTFLDQLSSAVSWHAKQVAAAKETKENPEEAQDENSKYASLFQYRIGILSPRTKEYKRIVEMYESTRNTTHVASSLRVKRIFTLEDKNGDKAYKEILGKIGNEKRLWHGTRAFNVLSILRRGLFVPPRDNRGTFAITGRMFGDGVYLSDQSTKSLNYSAGYWSGVRERNCFMFLADVAMGWEYRPNEHGNSFSSVQLRAAHTEKRPDGSPKYNSISVRGGTCGVKNNEMIVWNTDQIRLRYLVEFE